MPVPLSLIRYITRDELQLAMEEHGIGDANSIKEIISEVDTDNVSRIIIVLVFVLLEY